MGKICQICGANSGIYPLCKKHLEMKADGLVEKNPLTNQWELVEQNKKSNNCVICNSETSADYIFCKPCYQRIKKIRADFNHNRDSEKIKKHYYALKELIENADTIKEAEDNILLQFALAEELDNIYDDSYLLNRVKSDILKSIDKIERNSKKQKNSKDNFNDKDFREKWPREHQCEDGHYVRSLSEMLIDNWLYNNGYLHAYEKSVYMDTDPDAVVLSDFYLPKGNVYIEFWGLEDDEQYLKRKNKKIKLYEDNAYNRIDLTESDIKRLNDIMPRKLGEYIKKK